MITIKNIRKIPQYMLNRIKKLDTNFYEKPDGHTRFYKYYTLFKHELCEVIVAVRHYYKKWYCKQVVVHGIHTKYVYLRDIARFMSFPVVGLSLGTGYLLCTLVFWQSYLDLMILASSLFVLTIYIFKNMLVIRIGLLIDYATWFIYNVFLQAYVNLISIVISMVAIFIALFRYNILPFAFAKRGPKNDRDLQGNAQNVNNPNVVRNES